VYEKFIRVPATKVEAGDICAVCGIEDIQVCLYSLHSFILLHLFKLNFRRVTFLTILSEAYVLRTAYTTINEF
jgi:hypothetical protein